jgi:hypothetical protein
MKYFSLHSNPFFGFYLLILFQFSTTYLLAGKHPSLSFLFIPVSLFIVFLFFHTLIIGKSWSDYFFILDHDDKELGSDKILVLGEAIETAKKEDEFEEMNIRQNSKIKKSQIKVLIFLTSIFLFILYSNFQIFKNHTQIADFIPILVFAIAFYIFNNINRLKYVIGIALFTCLELLTKEHPISCIVPLFFFYWQWNYINEMKGNQVAPSLRLYFNRVLKSILPSLILIMLGHLIIPDKLWTNIPKANDQYYANKINQALAKTINKTSKRDQVQQNKRMKALTQVSQGIPFRPSDQSIDFVMKMGRELAKISMNLDPNKFPSIQDYHLAQNNYNQIAQEQSQLIKDLKSKNINSNQYELVEKMLDLAKASNQWKEKNKEYLNYQKDLFPNNIKENELWKSIGNLKDRKDNLEQNYLRFANLNQDQKNEFQEFSKSFDQSIGKILKEKAQKKGIHQLNIQQLKTLEQELSKWSPQKSDPKTANFQKDLEKLVASQIKQNIGQHITQKEKDIIFKKMVTSNKNETKTNITTFANQLIKKEKQNREKEKNLIPPKDFTKIYNFIKFMTIAVLSLLLIHFIKKLFSKNEIINIETNDEVVLKRKLLKRKKYSNQFEEINDLYRRFSFAAQKFHLQDREIPPPKILAGLIEEKIKAAQELDYFTEIFSVSYYGKQVLPLAHLKKYRKTFRFLIKSL